jgi:glycosyltransferase involved in cell wall biosynthesis
MTDSQTSQTNDRPRVSVGLPVYNGENYLEASIRSILDQTFTDFELVICDNRSTDRTEEICRRFAADDPRVRYHRNPENVGAHRNHLRVYELSRGRYFRWTGHDDMMAPEFLERCVEVLDRDPRYVLAFSQFDVIDREGVLVGKGDLPPAFNDPRPHRRLRAFWDSTPVHQVIYGVIRREALGRTQLMGDWYASDRALLIELALLGGFGRVEEVLFHHREHVGRSDYQSNKQLSWAPQTAGTPDLGYWKRLRHAAGLIGRLELPLGERLMVLLEYGRYGARRLWHWAPHLLRELAAAARIPVRSRRVTW